MLLSTVEFYILSEFKNRGVVRLNNETRYIFFSRRFRHRNRDSTIETNRTYAGKEIDTSEIIKIINIKRKLSRSTVFAALSRLCDSGSLTFFVKDERLLPIERTFVLTENGAYVLNSSMLFKKACDDENQDK